MSNRLVEVRLGSEQDSFLSIIVRGRAYRRSRDYWDGNWLHATVTIRTGKFSGEVPGLVRAEELAGFRKQLETVYKSLEGAAEFETMERWLSFQVEIGRTGSVTLSGTIQDEVSAISNRLLFAFEYDQTFLSSTLSQLQEAVTAYPVYGKP
ncbi:MAG: hypothetical protein IT319_02945 [Anaerolineae bacterium]|nr:hypothetical protein [Anaerolineae bacterium]